MGSSKTPESNIRGRNNEANIDPNMTQSRLLTDTNSLRNDLMSRNLYTPDRIYPITEKTNAQNVINAIGGIASLVAPYKSFNLKNTVYGRIISPADSTPLTEIGLAMLGKQFAMNSMSYTAKNTLPTIKVANLFDGSKDTKLFTKNKNFKITKKEDVTPFQQFLDNVVYYYPARDYPFSKYSTNVNYIRNTGTGQLTFLYQSINQNLYKQGFSVSSNYFGVDINNEIALSQYAEIAETQLIDRSTFVFDTNSEYRKYFNFFSNNPYSNILPSDDSVTQANTAMMISLTVPNENTSPTQEYAPSAEYIEKNLGVSNVRYTSEYSEYLMDNIMENYWIDNVDGFSENVAEQLVWGRDGVSNETNDNINYLRGTYGGAEAMTPSAYDFNRFKIRTGLLEYTKNLLNASEGAVVDLTRKAFTSRKRIVGFNGSPLWLSNTSTYALYSNTTAESGVRQHSLLDQYDRFAKAIRFQGNYVYGGNANSVTYSTVLPRIHPTLNTDKTVNNKNLMFSIENLAIKVISKDGVGIIDDEYGSSIPVCEVGPFMGRIMWFPPYNIEINESSSPKFDQTVMVGRNEPMYSYMYTERSATLSFTLLVDYPQNLKNFRGTEEEKHRLISEFFAFGGDAYEAPIPPVNPDLTIEEKTEEIEIIEEPNKPPSPDVIVKDPVRLYFPNDYPNVKEGTSDIIDILYKVKQYQIEENCAQGKLYAFTKDNNTYISIGLNKNIFVKEGIVKTIPKDNSIYSYLDTTKLPNGFSQYTATGTTDCKLNQNLYDVFSNADNRPYYSIKIIGAASSLGSTEYNYALGMRRAKVAEKLVKERIKAMFGKYPEELDITIEPLVSLGESQSKIVNSTGNTQQARRNKYEQIETIKERYTEISIVRKNKPPVENKISSSSTITEQEKVVVDKLKEDRNALESSKNESTNYASECVYNERDNGRGDAILKGFTSVNGNYYYPVFHSQTPQDFHNRLTFLHQCTRQGAANKYTNLTAKNSAFGRQPICILRVGDFFYTKVIIDNLQIDYADTTWDMNPEGMGVQPMIAKITLSMKVLGGQSLKGPIDALQNAVTFNYYANSTFSNTGMYSRPSAEADKQEEYIKGILSTKKTGIVTVDAEELAKANNSPVGQASSGGAGTLNNGNALNGTLSGGVDITKRK